MLVYDVAVTSEGVKQGAFFQLLKRHGIQVLDTVPVPEREQRLLLRCQFLKDVNLVSADTAADTDEVRLYLVYCSARQADAMWDELRKLPDGFVSFFLNLTTRSDGGGVLPRLCDAAGIRRQGGRAVHLDVDFGVSSSNRKLGKSGTIEYIHTDLLEPSGRARRVDFEGDPGAGAPISRQATPTHRSSPMISPASCCSSSAICGSPSSQHELSVHML